MTKKSRTVLTTQAQVIQTETSEKANTALRIGQMDQDLLDSLIHQDDTSLYTSVDIRYADIAAMLADQGSQTSKNLYYVTNAAAAGLTGYAYYELTTAVPTGALVDYRLVAAEQLLVDEIIFTGTDLGHKNRQLFWDETNRCPAYRNVSTDVTRQVGREVGGLAPNLSGGDIDNGEIISINAAGSIILAKADVLSTAEVLGWATEDIANGSVGEWTVFGLVHDVDTKQYPIATKVYLSSATAGDFTDTPPEIPNLVVPIGIIQSEQSGAGVADGVIYARIQHPLQPQESGESWAFSSFRDVGVSDNWIGGSYRTKAAFTPSGTPDTLGETDEMHSSHAIVVLGTASTDMVVRVTGDRWDPSTGTVTAAYTSDIDTSGGSTDEYFETPEHFVGIVSYTLLSGTGVIVNSGLVKYWDNNNKRFSLTMAEWTGFCGKDDIIGVDLEIYEKRDTAFAYNAAGAIFTPAYKLSDGIPTNNLIYKGNNFSFKLSGLSDVISGDLDEGILFKAIANETDSVRYSTISVQFLERRVL